jgi:predicted ATPase
MYLTGLSLEHVRLVERMDLEFTQADGSPRMFTVILAENGHAKTTLLQAIALAAAGVNGANKLCANAAQYFDKRWVPSADDRAIGNVSAVVDAEFSFSEERHATRKYPHIDPPEEVPPRLATTISAPHQWKQFQGDSRYTQGAMSPAAAGHGPWRLDPLDAARAQDLPLWFVAGYGTSRALPVPQPAAEPGNRSIDRLMSLFGLAPLVATGFVDVLTRLYGAETARTYVRTLRDVLVGARGGPGILPAEGSVQVTDLELRGQGGVRGTSDLVEAERVVLQVGDEVLKLPAVWLSAGFQSTIAWIADLIGQVALEAGEVIDPAAMEGLVLIDEIDQHLHPRWQARLVTALKRIFPRIQFVATTHSPMILPGLAPGEVVMLRPNASGSIEAEFPTQDPRLLTAAQLYREFFGMPDLFPSAVGERLRRYGLLAGVVQRSDAEEAEVLRLYRALTAEGVEVWEPVARSEAGG